MTPEVLSAELARVREQLRAVHNPLAMLEGIIAFAPFGLQIYRADGRSMFVNRAFREMYGSEPPSDYNLLSDELAANTGVLPLVERAFAGETIHVPAMWYDPGDPEPATVIPKRVGQEIWILPLLDADQKVAHIALVIKDVTSEMQAKEAARREAELRGTAERARARVTRLQHVTSRLASALTPQDAARVVLEEGLAALGALRGALHIVTNDEQLELLASVGFDVQDVPTITRLPPTLPSASRDAVRSGELLWLTSPAAIAAAYPERWAQIEHLGIAHVVAIPLAMGRAAAGALTFELCESPAGDEDDRAFALALARQAAQALERARLFREAQEAARRAEDASRAKDDFLNVLSHELRTPLNAIQGWAHLMAAHRGSDPGVVDRGVDVILRNVKAQVTLVDDMLDMARIIRGKLRLTLSDVDLATVIEAATDSVRPAASAKGVMLTVDVPKGLVVLADAERLQQVLWNLLSNAIKFTPRGGRVDVEAEVSGRDAIVIAVTDTGQGLAFDEIPYVFDRFRQVDSTSTRSKGGLGLGLAIVRHLVEAHGGRVLADSDGVGRGTTFEVELPCAPVSSAGQHEAEAFPIGESPSSTRKPKLMGRRVLAVDDDVDAVELVGIVLGHVGAEVRTAGSVAQAVGLLDGWTPDLVISDIGMPGEDGFALMQKLRALGGDYADIPAIALTAFARSDDADATRNAGFGWHLAKPVEPRELVRAAVQAVTAGALRRRDDGG